MLRRQFWRALHRFLHLAQQVSNAAKVSGRQQGHECRIEYFENLRSERCLGLLLEDVQQRRGYT